MRQWELFGITDSEPTWTAPRRTEGAPKPRLVSVADRPDAFDRLPAVFWTTDSALRLRKVTPAAAEHLGLPLRLREGRDILDVFGMDGPNLAILDAHVAALGGETATFTLPGVHGSVLCWVSPTHDGDDRVIGTFCVAMQEMGDTAPTHAPAERLEVA